MLLGVEFENASARIAILVAAVGAKITDAVQVAGRVADQTAERFAAIGPAEVIKGCELSCRGVEFENRSAAFKTSCITQVGSSVKVAEAIQQQTTVWRCAVGISGELVQSGYLDRKSVV